MSTFWGVLPEHSIDQWLQCETTYLHLRRCRLPIILHFFSFFLFAKLINIISWKLPWFFFYASRRCCINFKLYSFVVSLWKNKMGANMLKHQNGDMRFCTLTIDLLNDYLSDLWFIFQVFFVLFILKRNTSLGLNSSKKRCELM